MSQSNNCRDNFVCEGMAAPAKAVYRSMPVSDTINTVSPSFEIAPHSKEIPLKHTTSLQWIFEKAPNVPCYKLDRYKIVAAYCPAIVAAYICESLRIRSIVAKFDGATASCRTSDNLKYVIYLYAMPDDEETTVEVLRHSGCGFSFRIEREAVLNAARGLSTGEPSNLPFMLKIPESMLKNYKGPSEEEQTQLISRAFEGLHCDSFDDKIFILQNLSTTTSYDKVNREASEQMSSLIMKNTCEIRSFILAMLNANSEANDEKMYQIVSSCLKIFENSMSALEEIGALGTILSDNSSFVQEITNVLIKFVNAESVCQHNVASALNCLCLILKNSTDAGDIVNEENRKLVTKAYLVGKRYHFNLEQAAESTLAAMAR